MSSASFSRWDIFCTVVDNYGDIGVCWRLARQLAGERGRAVRLWVDDLASFARLSPRISPAREEQFCQGVEVRHWSAEFPEVLPGDVVVEAFACELPARFVEAMAKRAEAPRWVNLEYLSAEAWVAGCHGLPSPHPRLPLLKHFFFPGFLPGTGGLLLEEGLLARRAHFQADVVAQEAFWARLGLPARRSGELRVSLFSYANVATLDLLAAWSRSETPVTCVVPEGTATAALVAAEFGSGRPCRSGALEIHVLPFLEQTDYDLLLWACDLNFVRGEDSFVRAQWAARPFVWHIYPQEEDAHHVKLEAFLDLYYGYLPGPAAAAVRGMWRMWNGMTPGVDVWPGFLASLPVLRENGEAWANRLASLGSLAINLDNFVQSGL